MIHYSLLSTVESDIQICTGRERFPRSSEDNHLDPLINVEHRVDFLKVFHHIQCERILILGAIESQDYNRSCSWRSGWVVRQFDVSGWDGFVGLGDGD